MAALISLTTASVVPLAKLPVAAFAASPAFGVVGSVVKLDGRVSSDPLQQPLTYTWRFVSVPIGSQVADEGFRTLDVDTDSQSPSQVSFSPDTVGEYVIGLTVSNSVFSSSETTSNISIRAILIPHGRGLIPDGKFIWSYIRDVWTQVEGKEFFETLWSALIQITGTELLKLYQADFNKSIRDIQDRYQRRWIAYEPKLLLSEADLTFYFGNHYAGSSASTVNLALEGQAVILSADEVIVILGARAQNVAGENFTVIYSEDPSNVGTYSLQSLNAARNGYKLELPELDPAQDTIGTGVEWNFTFGSVNWVLGGSVAKKYALSASERPQLMDVIPPLFNNAGGAGVDNIRPGDVIHYASGPNAGFYRILTKIGAYITVDHAPPSYSDEITSTTIKSTVYRPVGYRLTQPAVGSTDTFSIPLMPGTDVTVLAPGRIVVVNGQSYTIVRSAVDTTALLPSIVITVDSDDLPSGIRGLNWRTPHSLISETQDFEALGVLTGDVLAFDILKTDSELTSEVSVQVVGVSGNALGFVLTDDEVLPGEIPTIPNKFFIQLTEDFGVNGLIVGRDGTLTFTGQALDYLTSLSSGIFQRKYWNQELDPTSEIQVNPVFNIKPKHIIRNSKIPVDVDLRSVPLLQEWIVQPETIVKDGVYYQVSNEKEFKLKRKPVVLNENLEFLIDDEFPFAGLMTINTGSVNVQADNADFVDRSMVPGDIFTVEAPLTIAGDYVIEKVISNSQVRLTRPIPAYVLGTLVNAKVKLTRKKSGQFLRFVPGQFTSLAPAPDRLWAEVSFFDNDQSVEDNFGILVGLKKETLENVSKNINYRQAVAGLMFAFTRGSAIDKVRLGAQILLGLPFAEHRGIIRSIEADYRLDFAGNPTLGRLLIEDVDAEGKALGTLRIYTYPIDAPSALAGVETNPATGVTYVVGDLVELFAPLTKGVEIIDYISNPLDANFSAIAQLQQFHSVRLRANDNIFTLNELDLVSDFLKKITPSYISYSLITASEFADVVNIDDKVINLLRGGESNLVDNVSLSIPAALMFDSKNANGINQIFWGNGNDEGVLRVLRTGYDLVIDAGAYQPDTLKVSSASGGFLNPKSNEEFEPPLTRLDLELPDILYIFEGPDKGPHAIYDTISDSELEIAGPEFGSVAQSGLKFAICRKVGTPYFVGASVVSGDENIQLNSSGNSAQLRVMGVAPGDRIAIDNGSGSTRFTIKTVEESSPGSQVWTKITVTPVPGFTQSDVFGLLYREAFRSFEGFGTYYSLLGPGNKPTLTGGADVIAIAEIGDEFETSDVLGEVRRYTILDPKNLYITPSLPAGTYAASLVRKKNSKTPIGWDQLELSGPTDEIDVTLIESVAQATCTSGSDTVVLSTQRTTTPAQAVVGYNPRTGGVLPGDRLIITSGANAGVDVGFGAGVYPIVSVSTNSVSLSVLLTNSESTSWSILRRR